MTENDKTYYDILWYLNEYDEINATDDIIRKSLKITKYDYENAKNNLIQREYIKQREDNINNVAWAITQDGKIEFAKLKKSEIAKIQSNVEAMGRTTLRLTWVLAISTAIAAVYYFLEVYDKHRCVSYWLGGSIVGLLLLAMWWLIF